MHERVGRGIARTWQVPRPFGEMSVRENVRVAMMPDSIWRLITQAPPADTERGTISSVGFGDSEADMLPGQLSMGDLRRLEAVASRHPALR